jgi:thiol-disulfide isomerase/thioredoxin
MSSLEFQDMNRRNLIIGAVAGVAGVAGVLFSQRRAADPAQAQLPVEPPAARQLPVENAAAPASAAGPTGTGGLDLWARRFDKPAGGELVFAELRGKSLVVNFWATWCPPCVKEMPELDRFARDFASKGWQVVGVAVDGPTPVREFLLKTPVGFPIGLAGFGGAQLARDLGNSGGGLPFTVVFDPSGKVVHTRLGQTSYDELAGWAKG